MQQTEKTQQQSKELIEALANLKDMGKAHSLKALVKLTGHYLTSADVENEPLKSRSDTVDAVYGITQVIVNL